MAQHDVRQLEGRIKDLHQSIAYLAEDKDYEELLTIIRRPGWTTPAEFMLVTGVVDAMLAHTQTLAGLKQVLLMGSRAVTAQ
jgi:hypothetical protein